MVLIYDELISSIYASTHKTRIKAIRELGELKNKRAVPHLITLLTDPDPHIRKSAIAALEALDDPQAIEPIIQMFKDDDDDVRGWAAAAFHFDFSGGSELSQAALPRLIELLSQQDADTTIRAGCAWAINQYGSQPQVIKTLLEALNDRSVEVRQSAVESLGALQEKQAVLPLAKALQDEEPEVRWVAANALGRIGDTRAIPYLIEALQDSSEDVIDEAITSLGYLKAAEAIPHLAQFLHAPSSNTRYILAKAFEIMGSKTALESLRILLNDSDEEVQHVASRTIENLNK